MGSFVEEITKVPGVVVRYPTGCGYALWQGSTWRACGEWPADLSANLQPNYEARLARMLGAAK